AKLLHDAEGAWVPRTVIREAVGHNVESGALSTSLAQLAQEDKAESRQVSGRGRPREEWRWLGMQSGGEKRKEKGPSVGEKLLHFSGSPDETEISTNGHAAAADVAPAVPVIAADRSLYTYVNTDAGLRAIIPELSQLPTLYLDTETAVQEGAIWKRSAKGST